MLFKLPLADQQFWMKDTCVSLDLAFASEDGVILGTIVRAHAFDESLLGIGQNSRYVLEVPGGTFERAHVHAGDRLGLPAVVRQQAIQE